MDIDKRLAEINIIKLINDIGIPFEDITDEDISKCLEQKVLLTTNSIYNKSEDIYSYKNNKIFDLLKISTIVNEINNNTYNYNYPIVIWEDIDDDGKITYDTDGVGLYHIRAFYYCKKNIYMSINHSG
jgi:hypothetical protein